MLNFIFVLYLKIECYLNVCTFYTCIMRNVITVGSESFPVILKYKDLCKFVNIKVLKYFSSTMMDNFYQDMSFVTCC